MTTPVTAESFTRGTQWNKMATSFERSTSSITGKAYSRDRSTTRRRSPTSVKVRPSVAA